MTSRDITASIQKPDMRDLARRALAQGFRPGGLRKHGVWLLPPLPNNVDTISIAHTTGDRRAYANVLAELKRFGFKDENEPEEPEGSRNGKVRGPNTSPLALKVIEALVSANKPMTAQELSAMVNEPWTLSFSDTVRHMADAGQVERYKKITLPGAKVPYRANVYVPKGYTPPAPSVPQPIVDIDIPDMNGSKPTPEPEPESRPELPPPPPPLPPAAETEVEAPWKRWTRTATPLVHRVVDAMIELDKPVHAYDLADHLGEPPERADSISSTLSLLSRMTHQYNPLGNVKKRDKVQRPGTAKPIIRYEWVWADQPGTEPQPQPPEPQMPSPAPAPDEEVPVAVTVAANRTTLLGKPLQFWEDVLHGLAYGLSRTREREGDVR